MAYSDFSTSDTCAHFDQYDIPVPKGVVVTDANHAKSVISEIGEHLPSNYLKRPKKGKGGHAHEARVILWL
jgi:succinyl-CoA synthetase beta subunit